MLLRPLYDHCGTQLSKNINTSSSSFSLCFFLFLNCVEMWENPRSVRYFHRRVTANELGGRKRSHLELRARAEGRSSAHKPSSSRTGPRLRKADRCKAERPGLRDNPMRAPMKTSFVLGIDPGKSFFAATLAHSTGERVWKAKQFDMSRDGSRALRSSLPEGDLTVGVEASGTHG